ncbi:ATP-binding cassette domain-containing protein [Candidatus Lokiarchaeum ossiferum]|uniref:ATP-binding cassette domain-containing protein n=1 Tax=Candidatus Lokiarchaeum ossiferum TaxID=2951803 RepID=UPI00352CC10F
MTQLQKIQDQIGSSTNGNNSPKFIGVRGATQNNLKYISVDIPKHQLVVFTGVSGSGKSSLVFDTIYTESQRQLVESFSTFARSRLPKLSRPEVDELHNLSPVIVIDQKPLGRNPRSTVGTATELYTYLRLLYSRCGTPQIGDSSLFSFNTPNGMCHKCKGLGHTYEINLDKLIDWDLSLKEGAIQHPDFKVSNFFFRLIKKSKLFDINKPLKDFTPSERDQLLYLERTKLDTKNKDALVKLSFEGIITRLTRHYINGESRQSLESPRNRPFFNKQVCSLCNGARLNKSALSVKISSVNINQAVQMELEDLYNFICQITTEWVQPIIKKMKLMIQNLIDVGLGYLSLDQPTGTLSGGESQRVKMTRQLGCDLVDMVYILDEPSIGLHPRDISKLIDILFHIRDKGNTVIVVEHDPEIIRFADYIIDMGPEAGINGGNVVFQGNLNSLLNADTLTAKYIRRLVMSETDIQKTKKIHRRPTGWIPIQNASLHNLKNITVDLPTGILTCITGVAGSGKSTLINDIFLESHPEVVAIDQSGVFTSSRSIPATYLDIFTKMRELFAQETGKPKKLFSFNSSGACPKCKGLGVLKIEMSFLDEVVITCDECKGRRYHNNVLELKYKGKNIFEILKLNVDEALQFFSNKQICNKLQWMQDVGLGYLEIGQPLNTLSGGECQRLKLATRLYKKGNIYFLDEPTTGLHMADIDRLIRILHQLVDSGNSVFVIEHNLDVIKEADWIIDLGPEGGNNGGKIMAEGPVEKIMRIKESYTGRYLASYLRKAE